MARVQEYERQVSNKIPGVINASPEAFGSNVAQAGATIGDALGNAGNVIMQRAYEIKQQENQTKLLDVQNRMSADLNKLLIDPDKGLLNKKLGNATGVIEEYNESAAQIREKYRGELTTEDQLTAFDLNSQKEINDKLVDVAKHKKTQLDQWTNDQYEQSMTNSISNVYAKPETMYTELDNAIQKNEWYGSTMKLDRSTIDTMNEKTKGRFIATATLALMEKKDADSLLKAEKLFKDNEKSIALFNIDAAQSIRSALTTGISDAYKSKLGNLASQVDYSTPPEKVDEIMTSIKDVGTKLSERINPDEAQNLVRNSLASAASKYIVSIANVEKDPKKAQDALDALKKKWGSDMADGVFTDIQAKLNDANNELSFKSDWDTTYSQQKNSDGTYNLGTILDTVKKKYTDPVKQELMIGKAVEKYRLENSIVEAKLSQNFEVAREGVADSFYKKVPYSTVEARILKDPTLSDYQRDMAIRYAKDIYDIKPPGTSSEEKKTREDLSTMYYVIYADAINAGNMTEDQMKEVDSRWTAGVLSRSDWQSLRTMWRNHSNKVQDVAVKEQQTKFWAYYDSKTTGKYKKDELSQLKYVMYQYLDGSGKGKTLEEWQGYLDKQLEEQKKGWWIFSSKTPNFQNTAQNLESQSKKLNNAYEQFTMKNSPYTGKQLADQFVTRMMNQGGHKKSNWTTVDFDNYSNSLFKQLKAKNVNVSSWNQNAKVQQALIFLLVNVDVKGRPLAITADNIVKAMNQDNWASMLK